MSLDTLRLEEDILPVASGQSRVVRALLLMMAAKHRPTYVHLRQVAKYCRLLATKLGLSDHQVKQVTLAGLLHDIGKAAVEDAILNKPGRLDDREMLLMSDHAEWGADILGGVGGLRHLSEAVRHHHEWYNGQGYPAGLTGLEIPLAARMIAIADAFDTMTTVRPYRNPVSVEAALAELLRSAGTQFDADLVTAFAAAINEATDSNVSRVQRPGFRVAKPHDAVEPLALRLAR